jgi:uncharacterized oxidoreductase
MSNPEDFARRSILAAAVTGALLAAAGGGRASAQSRTALRQSRNTLPLSGNTILITGGGTGIGRGLAEQFHRLDNKVIIASRRTALLREVAAQYPGMEAMTLDVRDPAMVRRFAQEIIARHPDLNVVFNNAGIMRRENLLDQQPDLADSRDHVETNLNGPIRLTAALLPHLRTRARARIVNTSSGLAFVPLASHPTYSATKAGIHSYSISLRHQLRDTPVEVIELAPPGVRTNLTPGQINRQEFMPLPDFIAEVMSIFRRQPVPDEILVQRVLFQRRAEAEDRFAATFDKQNRAAADHQ